MLVATVFEKMGLEDFTRARVSELELIALDPIDFDSLTPDERPHVEENAKKAAWSAWKREHATKLPDDWWDSFEEGSLGTTLFGIGADA